MVTVPVDFLAFLKKLGFEEAQAEDVGQKLAAYEIFSQKQFLGFFSAGPSICYIWRDHSDWEQKGGILSKLRDMFIKLQHSENTHSKNPTGS